MTLPSVSETLFIPLFALARESEAARPILRDPQAVELARKVRQWVSDSRLRLSPRLVAARFPPLAVTSLALRIRRYDRYVRSFLEKDPEGIVVNLGCGLDIRRGRVDNGRVRWYDVDLPEVIALRRGLLPETDRVRFIASSVSDFEWFGALPDAPGRRFLFVAEGLFMYLTEPDVRSLVLELLKRHPGAELVAEVAHRKIVRLTRGRFNQARFRRRFGLSGGLAYRFGLADGREMEGWAPGIRLLDEWTYFDENEPKLGWIRWFARWPLIGRAQWTVHLTLG